MRKCIECKTKTPNPKFCDRSCSAKYNNRKFPKRKPEGECKCCQKPISTPYTYCNKCWKIKRSAIRLRSTKTIGEYRKMPSIVNRHPSWLHSHIRELCRVTHAHLTKGPCEKCGYSLHVELCHLKPLSSFSDRTRINTVNARSNILALCRNCHWELDHEYFTPTQIKRIFTKRTKS